MNDYFTGSLQRDLDDKFSPKRFETEYDKAVFDQELDRRLLEDAKRRSMIRQRVRSVKKPKEIPYWALEQTEEYQVADEVVSDLVNDLKRKFENLISQFKSELAWTMLSDEQREKLLKESRTMTMTVSSDTQQG